MNWRKGFTLIELLIVVTIIAVLAGAAIPYVADYVEEARYAKAKADCDSIANAVALYETRRGTQYTDTVGTTLVNTGFLSKLPVDPWGALYIVKSSTSTVYSRGPDGTQGTADDIQLSYAPPLALTAAYWVDADKNDSINTNDIVSLKFCRAITTPGVVVAGGTEWSISTGNADFGGVSANWQLDLNDPTYRTLVATMTSLTPALIPGKSTVNVYNSTAKFLDLNLVPCKTSSIKVIPK